MYGVPSLPRAAQTVFGGGPKNAPIMLVGEQPGDYEDVAGKPFVGPAGKIMDRALEEAGIDRSLPPMARGGNASGEASTRRLSRIDRGTDVFRFIVPRHAGARQNSIVEARAKSRCDSSSVLFASAAGPRIEIQPKSVYGNELAGVSVNEVRGRAAAARYLLAGDGNCGDEHCQQQEHLDLLHSSDRPQFSNFVAPKDWNFKHQPCNRITPLSKSMGRI